MTTPFDWLGLLAIKEILSAGVDGLDRLYTARRLRGRTRYILDRDRNLRPHIDGIRGHPPPGDNDDDGGGYRTRNATTLLEGNGLLLENVRDGEQGASTSRLESAFRNVRMAMHRDELDDIVSDAEKVLTDDILDTLLQGMASSVRILDDIKLKLLLQPCRNHDAGAILIKCPYVELEGLPLDQSHSYVSIVAPSNARGGPGSPSTNTVVEDDSTNGQAGSSLNSIGTRCPQPLWPLTQPAQELFAHDDPYAMQRLDVLLAVAITLSVASRAGWPHRRLSTNDIVVHTDWAPSSLSERDRLSRSAVWAGHANGNPGVSTTFRNGDPSSQSQSQAHLSSEDSSNNNSNASNVDGRSSTTVRDEPPCVKVQHFQCPVTSGCVDGCNPCRNSFNMAQRIHGDNYIAAQYGGGVDPAGVGGDGGVHDDVVRFAPSPTLALKNGKEADIASLAAFTLWLYAGVRIADISDDAVSRVPWPLRFLVHDLGHAHFEALQGRDDASGDSAGSRFTRRSSITHFPWHSFKHGASKSSNPGAVSAPLQLNTIVDYLHALRERRVQPHIIRQSLVPPDEASLRAAAVRSALAGARTDEPQAMMHLGLLWLQGAESVNSDSDDPTISATVLAATPISNATGNPDTNANANANTNADADADANTNANANPSRARRLTPAQRQRAAYTAYGCFASAARFGERKGLMKMARMQAYWLDGALPLPPRDAGIEVSVKALLRCVLEAALRNDALAALLLQKVSELGDAVPVIGLGVDILDNIPSEDMQQEQQQPHQNAYSSGAPSLRGGDGVGGAVGVAGGTGGNSDSVSRIRIGELFDTSHVPMKEDREIPEELEEIIDGHVSDDDGPQSNDLVRRDVDRLSLRYLRRQQANDNDLPNDGNNDQQRINGHQAPQFENSDASDVCDDARVCAAVVAVAKCWRRGTCGLQVKTDEARTWLHVALRKAPGGEHAGALLELGLLERQVGKTGDELRTAVELVKRAGGSETASESERARAWYWQGWWHHQQLTARDGTVVVPKRDERARQLFHRAANCWIGSATGQRSDVVIDREGQIACADALAMYSRCLLLGIGGVVDEDGGHRYNHLAREAGSIPAFCRYSLILEKRARDLYGAHLSPDALHESDTGVDDEVYFGGRRGVDGGGGGGARFLRPPAALSHSERRRRHRQHDPGAAALDTGTPSVNTARRVSCEGGGGAAAANGTASSGGRQRRSRILTGIQRLVQPTNAVNTVPRPPLNGDESRPWEGDGGGGGDGSSSRGVGGGGESIQSRSGSHDSYNNNAATAAEVRGRRRTAAEGIREMKLSVDRLLKKAQRVLKQGLRGNALGAEQTANPLAYLIMGRLILKNLYIWTWCAEEVVEGHIPPLLFVQNCKDEARRYLNRAALMGSSPQWARHRVDYMHDDEAWIRDAKKRFDQSFEQA